MVLLRRRKNIFVLKKSKLEAQIIDGRTREVGGWKASHRSGTLTAPKLSKLGRAILNKMFLKWLSPGIVVSDYSPVAKSLA